MTSAEFFLAGATAVKRWNEFNNITVIKGNETSQLMLASYHGTMDCVERLLKVPGIKIELQNDEGWHALMCASAKGHTRVVELLLNACQNRCQLTQHLINLANTTLFTSLMVASGNGHVNTASLLVERGACIDFQAKSGLSSLMLASFFGHKDIVSLLLENGANVNLQENAGYSSLMLASQNGCTEAISMLLQYDADVNLKCKNNSRTALMLASANGHTESVSLLVKKSSVNVQDSIGFSCLMLASQNGHCDTVSLLAHHGASTDLKSYEDEWSALTLAVQNSNNNVVSLLLQLGASVNTTTSDGWFPLMLASQNGDTSIAALLLQNGAEISEYKDGWSPLMIASQNGHTETVSVLLQNGADINVRARDGWSSLMLASQNGCLQTASLLIEKGADVNNHGTDGWSSLMLACQDGHTETVSLLLKHAAHINMQANDGMCSLTIACQNGYLNVVSLLVENGADVNLTTTSGWSSLMIALNHSHVEIALYLISAGADVNMSNSQGESTLSLAVKYDLPLVLKKIVTNSRTSINQLDGLGYSPLMIAAFNGHTEVAAVLLKEGAKVGISNFTDYSSLHLQPQDIKLTSDYRTVRGSALDIAIIQGHEKVVSLFLDYQPQVQNVYLVLRSIILKHAQENAVRSIPSRNIDASPEWENYSKIFQLLLSHDKDFLNRIQCTKPSILYMACVFGVVEMVEILLELGVEPCDLYRTDKNGLTYWSNLITMICSSSLLSLTTNKEAKHDITDMLSHIEWAQMQQILSLLMSKGLDITHSDNSGSFALGIASKEGHKKLAKFLLDSTKAKVDQQDKDGISSLMAAAASGCMPICSLLVRYGAKVDLQDSKGWSALMFAVAGGYTDLVVYLLDKGAQINLQDMCGTSPLMLSCFTGLSRVTKVLVAHDADINHQNEEGITALMMSSYNGHSEIVELLIKYDADIDAQTHIGKSALDFSTDQEHHEISKLLLEFGARERKSCLGKRTLDMRDQNIIDNDCIVTFSNSTQLEERLDKIEQILQTLVNQVASFKAEGSTPENKDHCTNRPTLKEACALLHPIAYDWHNIGIQLGLENDMLKVIKYDCNSVAKDCLREMLCQWLNQGEATWEKLAEAVKDTDHQNFARKIRKMIN